MCPVGFACGGHLHVCSECLALQAPRAQAKRFVVFNHNKDFIGKRLPESGRGGGGVVHSWVNR
jgi:hypothetical protein